MSTATPDDRARGDRTAGDPDAAPYGAAGSRLGLPNAGPGSVASWGRRLGALFVDWFSSYLVAVALTGGGALRSGSAAGWVPLAVWFAQVWLFTALTGASVGQRVLHLAVLRLDHRPVGLGRALIRTLLVALVVPPLVFDRDSRGLHDLVAGTVVVNGPRRGTSVPR